MRDSSRAVLWLRISFWVGALADAFFGVLLLVPASSEVVFGLADQNHGPDYLWASRIGGVLMFAGTFILIWGDQDPLSRRGLLPIIALWVFPAVAIVSILSVISNYISAERMIPIWIKLFILFSLFMFSYFSARKLE